MENGESECRCTKEKECDWHAERSAAYRAERAKERSEELTLFRLAMPDLKDEQVKRVESAWDVVPPLAYLTKSKDEREKGDAALKRCRCVYFKSLGVLKRFVQSCKTAKVPAYAHHTFKKQGLDIVRTKNPVCAVVDVQSLLELAPEQKK